MFKLRSEHLDAFRLVARAQFPQRLEAELRSQNVPAQHDSVTGDLLVADRRGYQSRIVFRPDGLPAEFRSPLGAAHSLEYDDKGRLSARTWPNGDRLELIRDNQGRLNELYRPGLLRYRFEYDKEGRLTRVEYPDATETRLQHEETTEGNRKVTVIDRNNNPFEYVASPQGRQRSISDPLGRTIHFERNSEDQLSSVRYPDGSTERLAYDAALSLGVISARDGNTILRAFDERGRPKGIFWHDGSSLELKYQDDQVAKAINSTTIVQREITKESIRETSTHGTDVHLRFDPDQRLTRVEISDRETIEYQYDADGQVTAVRDWEGRETHLRWSSGTIEEIRFANGITERRSSALNGLSFAREATDSKGRWLGRQIYDYDLCERLIHFTDEWGSLSQEKLSRSLEYDAEGRITKEIDAHSRRPISSFEYDKKGNLTRSNQSIVSFGLMDEPLSFEGQAIQHDALGNMTVLPGASGRLRCTFAADGSLREALTGSKSIKFSYDALGRRVSKTDGQTVWRYGWIAHQLLWEEQELPSGEIIRRDYLWLPNSVVPMAFREEGRTYWLQADARGAIIRAFDENGRIAWRGIYDSFGLLVSETGALRQPWRLAGQYHDEETGLYFNLRRYYSPLLRSYLSRDPRWFERRSTNYSYARNDPWNQVDPFGTVPLLLVIGAVFLAAAVATIIASAIDSALKKASDALDRQFELGDPACIICSALDGLREGGLWGLNQVGGVFVGIGEGIRDLATGLGGMLEGAWDLTGGWIFDPEASKETWNNLTETAQAIWDDPTAIWDAITQPIVEDWQAGRYGEAIGRGLFEVGSVILGTKGADKINKLSRVRILGRAGEVAEGGTNLLKGTRYTEKVQKQMQPHLRTGLRDNHGFPLEVDNYAGDGRVSKIFGGDGVERTKIELDGGFRGKEGHFEWIVEPDGSVNHRLFVPKGGQ